jgi:hypothetical protein
VQSEEITLQQAGTSEMKADLLTKPLSGSIVKKSRDSLQITNQIAPANLFVMTMQTEYSQLCLVYQGVQRYLWNIKVDTIRALHVLAENGATKT